MFLIALVILLAVFGSGHFAKADSCSMLALVNAERNKAGLGPMVADVRLNRAAEMHSQLMSAIGQMSHQLPGQADPFQRMRDQGVSFSSASENVAAGQTSEAQVHDSWMNSAGHRANILGPYNAFGYGRSGNFYTQEFAQDFAAVNDVQDACRQTAGSSSSQEPVPQPVPQPVQESAQKTTEGVFHIIENQPAPVPPAIPSDTSQDSVSGSPAPFVNTSESTTMAVASTIAPAPSPVTDKHKFRAKYCRLKCKNWKRVCRWKCRKPH
jgi:hypothetical protein